MKKQLIESLLKLGCLQVRPKNPFTYASGLIGPLYCDNRLSLSDPKTRNLIADLFKQIAENIKIDVDAVMGVATAGIPHGMLLADRLNLPFLYIRSKAKGHGRENLIEGKWQEGMKVLMVEDLINQGSSISSARENILQAGGKVDECFSIVDYEFYKPKQNFTVHSLVSFSELMTHCQESGYLSAEDISLAKKWHEDPTSMYKNS
jgi:orotate phosphoribosyltransferase